MAKTRTKIIILILALALVGIFYVWHSMPDAPRWERGFSQIETGDSKQKVIEVLGEPTEINDCHYTRYGATSEIAEKCAEEYWYIAFMQEWIYVIDRDGKVATKSHSVSP